MTSINTTKKIVILKEGFGLVNMEKGFGFVMSHPHPSTRERTQLLLLSSPGN